MVKNMKEQKSELFFVEIREPGEVRRHILETLKGVLELLQKLSLRPAFQLFPGTLFQACIP